MSEETTTPSTTASTAPAVAGTSTVDLTAGKHRTSALTFTFTVERAHAPALRSALEELQGRLADRAAGSNTRLQDAALTAALVAMGTLRAAVYPSVPAGDERYTWDKCDADRYYDA